MYFILKVWNVTTIHWYKVQAHTHTHTYTVSFHPRTQFSSLHPQSALTIGTELSVPGLGEWV